MNDFLKSLNQKVTSCKIPFQHWEISDPLNKETINEIVNISTPKGERVYDGTRAADHTGRGIDGKLRLFINNNNCHSYPNLTSLINTLQKIECIKIISKYLNRNLDKSYVRLEVISDKKGFWLKPHKDIKEKIMTMLIWINPYNESEKLGTDFYDSDFNIVKTSKYIDNTGYFFSSGGDTWHGLEKKEIVIERKCIQINYVSFKTDWPVQNI